MKPSLIWIEPSGGTFVLVDARFMDKGYIQSKFVSSITGEVHTYLVFSIEESISMAISKPILQHEGDLPEVLLSEHVLVPHNELDGAKLFSEGHVDGKVEGGIFGVVFGIDVLF
jgi:hypothetical protein